LIFIIPDWLQIISLQQRTMKKEVALQPARTCWTTPSPPYYFLETLQINSLLSQSFTGETQLSQNFRLLAPFEVFHQPSNAAAEFRLRSQQAHHQPA